MANSKRFTLGFSPCPNDTFIFDALVNNKIDIGPHDFDVVLEDVETLNLWALNGKLDISKISYGVLGKIVDKYSILSSGGALGKGVGPLLISKRQITDVHSQISDLTIAIPGENTTAHMLFHSAFPQATRKVFMIFSEIENAVLSGKVDCGVIIHENRFTYQQKGLVKLIDLGNYWEELTGGPIPLGGIVIKKEIDPLIQQEINSLIRKSIEYAYSNYPILSEYVKKHAQEMDDIVMKKHIDLYVNHYSIDIGVDGKQAVLHLLKQQHSHFRETEVFS